MKRSLGISKYLEEISSLSHSIVFLYFFALVTEEGFLAILWNSAFNGYIFPFLLCFLLLFFSQVFVRPPQTAILLFCISFSWWWSWSLSPVQCHEPPSIVHQALCLSDLSLKSISYFYYIIIRDLIEVIPEWSSGFPHYLQFKSEFLNKEFMIWVTKRYFKKI